MMKLDVNHANLKEDIFSYQEKINKLHQAIMNQTGAGNDFMGWVHWAKNYDRDEFAQIKEVAAKVKDKAEVLVVCDDSRIIF